MMTSDHRPPGSRRRTALDSVILAGGSVFTGVLAYVFFALATRSLGADEAAPVSVLWSYWAVAASLLTFSVQHWMIATLAGGGEATVAQTLPRIAGLGAVLTLASGAVALVAAEQVFGSAGVTFPAMVAAVTAGCLFSGVVRGALAGRRRYVASAASLVAENGVRVTGAAVAVAAGADAVGFGVALVLGPLSGLVWIRALRSHHGRTRQRPVASPLASLSGIAGGSLVAQVVLTGAPVVLASIGGSATDVTSVFVAMALWRAPHLVAMGVAPQATRRFARLADDGQLTRLARARALILILTVIAASIAALLAVTGMPWLLRAVFGPDVGLSTQVHVLLGVGSAMSLGNLALLVLLAAQGCPRGSTAAWALALVPAAGWLAVGSDSPVERVATAFLLAQLTALALSVTFSARCTGRGDPPEGGGGYALGSGGRNREQDTTDPDARTR